MHIVIVIVSLLNFDGLFKKTIKDNGHTVFDFISIGNKSTAPILSSENGRASKTKSYNDSEEESNINKQNNNITKLPNTKTDDIKDKKQEMKPKQDNNKEKKEKLLDNKIDDNKKDKKAEKPKSNDNKKQETKPKEKIAKQKSVTKLKINKEKKQNKNIEKTSNKQSNKNNNKALVNLKKQNKKTPSNKTSNKKSLNSFLDNVLADGDYENTGANAESLGETLTATQVDNIRNTIRKCWHFPAGLKDAETLVVDIKMELDRNGYVKKAEVVDKNRMKRDSGFKIAAENAQRAVLDQRCNPLPLPKEKYEEWKDLELSFNPKDMLR